MSQRNPMNERYTTEKHIGSTRKSAASAKPKSKAAASVTLKTSKKTPEQRKQEQKAARRQEQERQRELDRKYYKPDTLQYKKLRRIWWVALIGAILCVIASWLLREVKPEWIAMVALFAAYGLIIFAFYIDFSKIRKERKAYQERMLALELEEAKKNRGKKTGDSTKDTAESDSENQASEPKKKSLFASFGKSSKAKENAEVSTSDNTDKTNGSTNGGK